MAKGSIVAAMLALGTGVAIGQGAQGWRERSVVAIASGEWTGPRLADGQPDVQGHWSNTIGNHNNFTESAGRRRRCAGRRSGSRNQTNRAPSRVSDPPDGQVPYQPWARAKQQEFGAHLEDPTRPEYVEPLARCAPAGPTKSFMWHGYEIRQFPGYVLFLFDSGTRIIHLDAKPHLAENVKLWNGDSRGHWEGNTLVVDVTNNNSKSRFAQDRRVRQRARDHSRALHLRQRRRALHLRGGLHRSDRAHAAVHRDDSQSSHDGQDAAGRLEQHHLPGDPRRPEPIIEAYERTCVENNGEHGGVAVESK